MFGNKQLYQPISLSRVNKLCGDMVIKLFLRLCNGIYRGFKGSLSMIFTPSPAPSLTKSTPPPSKVKPPGSATVLVNEYNIRKSFLYNGVLLNDVIDLVYFNRKKHQTANTQIKYSYQQV